MPNLVAKVTEQRTYKTYKKRGTAKDVEHNNRKRLVKRCLIDIIDLTLLRFSCSCIPVPVCFGLLRDVLDAPSLLELVSTVLLLSDSCWGVSKIRF